MITRYKVLKVTSATLPSSVEKKMNELSDDDWDYLHADQGFIYFFKQELEEEEDDGNI